MITEKTIQLLIFVHAFLGGLALISGMISIIITKGKTVHRKSGLVFFYSMLISSLSGMAISVMPKHESPFLFSIGIFSAYFVLSGYRALKYKSKNLNLTIDKIISWIMLITAVGMIFYNPIFNNQLNIILSVFGTIGLIFSIKDLLLFRTPEKLRKGWLKSHAGKMTGGYISATTAFIVVNNYIPGLYGWFLPGVVGGIYIAYWMRKLSSKELPARLRVDSEN